MSLTTLAYPQYVPSQACANGTLKEFGVRHVRMRCIDQADLKQGHPRCREREREHSNNSGEHRQIKIIQKLM